MNRREVLALALLVIAIALSPVALNASFAFGLLTFGIGVSAIVLFMASRPGALPSNRRRPIGY
jgi:hypothetical protein